MSKLVIICGLPGSGKTTLAKELSKRLNIACIYKDEIKECLFEIQGGNCLEDSKRCGKDTMKLFFHLIEGQLKNGVDLIIETPFNFSEDYSIVEKWEKDFNLDVYSVICSIDFETRKGRFENRKRHYAHFDKDRNMLEKHLDGTEYDYRDIPGKHILVKTNKSVEKLVEDVVGSVRSIPCN